MAILFDAALEEYIILGTELAALRTTASMSFWIKTTDAGSVDFWNAPCVAGIEEDGPPNDDIFWGYIPAAGTIGISKGNLPFTSATVINDGSWHHVVLTWDSATGAIQIIVDGVLETTGTSTTGDLTNTFQGLGLREHSTVPASRLFLDGSLADVRVYSRILDESEGQTIFASNGHDGIVDGLVHRWTMDDNIEGTPALSIADRSNTPNDGTPSGTAAEILGITLFQGGPNRFDLAAIEGDRTALFINGFEFSISGATEPGNNGAFTCSGSMFTGGQTSVSTVESTITTEDPTNAVVNLAATQPVHIDSPLDFRRRVA